MTRPAQTGSMACVGRDAGRGIKAGLVPDPIMGFESNLSMLPDYP